MLAQLLLNFAIVVLSQLLFLYTHARTVGDLGKLKKYLLQGMFLGVPFGIIFDLVVGKYIGIFYYEIGFDMWFLVLNGFFSYGFMIANVLLLFHHSLFHMYAWSFGLGFCYELINYLFPVWQWTFLQSNLLEYLVVVGAAYTGLTWLMMLALRICYRVRFKLIPF